ncbi:ricin-type beta-trefoil lectin domain protein, partial [Nodosilinea sp. FACHB-131]|nr:ricin-type beta-trefoil lectin domain protein [Nodosilinea sp. FACHB-131]
TLSGKCIDVDGIPGTNNAAKLQLFDCEFSGRDPFQGRTTDQRWELTSDGFIRNTLSGKCIDVDGIPGTNNAAKLQLFDCEFSGRDPFQGRTTDQRWELTSGGFIRNTLSGKCIDVDGIPGTNNAAKLQLFDCEFSGRDPFQGRTTDQRWRLQ